MSRVNARMSVLPDSGLSKARRGRDAKSVRRRATPVGARPRARPRWGQVSLLWQTAVESRCRLKALGPWGPWCLLANDRYPPVFFALKNQMTTRRELANCIRALAMDAVQRANSGHPGAPMGMADIAQVLWRDVLKFNPDNPTWLDRDRFVLSNGHASMLLYSVLHLTGYPLSMDEIKNFRQWGSKPPGHPERELHLGIETTTGPLGQGFANSVGMALAERSLAATFNRPGHAIIDHHTYVFVGDGCMMEGISHEAASFAGMQQLGKLIAIYDDNGISIYGKVAGWFGDNTAERFEAYGWHVQRNVDGQNSDAVAAALAAAAAVTDKPSFICAKTMIGYGAPKTG